MLYWLTNTAVSAARPYWENRNENLISAAAQKTDQISVPLAITAFSDDDLCRAPETWARRAFPSLIYFHQADRAGHFAAWEEPQLFSDEVRAAFRGEWYVDDDGHLGSLWPPCYRARYDLRWMVEDGAIIGDAPSMSTRVTRPASVGSSSASAASTAPYASVVTRASSGPSARPSPHATGGSTHAPASGPSM